MLSEIPNLLRIISCEILFCNAPTFGILIFYQIKRDNNDYLLKCIISYFQRFIKNIYTVIIFEKTVCKALYNNGFSDSIYPQFKLGKYLVFDK